MIIANFDIYALGKKNMISIWQVWIVYLLYIIEWRRVSIETITIFVLMLSS